MSKDKDIFSNIFEIDFNKAKLPGVCNCKNTRHAEWMLGATCRTCLTIVKLDDTDTPTLAPSTSIVYTAPPLPEGTPEDWNEPDWGKNKVIHEWKQYISKEVQAMWKSFNSSQKQALARQAQQAADKEKWE